MHGPAQAQVREAIARRQLPLVEVARRAGVSLRTVQRLMAGQAVSSAKLEAMAGAMGVSLDIAAVVTHQVLGQVRQELARTTPRASATNGSVPHGAAVPRTGPVSGWAEAARLLGISDDTLLRRRKAAQDTTRWPWWCSIEALHAWYVAILTAQVGP